MLMAMMKAVLLNLTVSINYLCWGLQVTLDRRIPKALFFILIVLSPADHNSSQW